MRCGDLRVLCVQLVRCRHIDHLHLRVGAQRLHVVVGRRCEVVSELCPRMLHRVCRGDQPDPLVVDKGR